MADGASKEVEPTTRASEDADTPIGVAGVDADVGAGAGASAEAEAGAEAGAEVVAEAGDATAAVKPGEDTTEVSKKQMQHASSNIIQCGDIVMRVATSHINDIGLSQSDIDAVAGTGADADAGAADPSDVTGLLEAAANLPIVIFGVGAVAPTEHTEPEDVLEVRGTRIIRDVHRIVTVPSSIFTVARALAWLRQDDRELFENIKADADAKAKAAAEVEVEAEAEAVGGGVEETKGGAEAEAEAEDASTNAAILDDTKASAEEWDQMPASIVALMDAAKFSYDTSVSSLAAEELVVEEDLANLRTAIAAADAPPTDAQVVQINTMVDQLAAIHSVATAEHWVGEDPQVNDLFRTVIYSVVGIAQDVCHAIGAWLDAYIETRLSPGFLPCVPVIFSGADTIVPQNTLSEASKAPYIVFLGARGLLQAAQTFQSIVATAPAGTDGDNEGEGGDEDEGGDEGEGEHKGAEGGNKSVGEGEDGGGGGDGGNDTDVVATTDETKAVNADVSGDVGVAAGAGVGVDVDASIDEAATGVANIAIGAGAVPTEGGGRL